MLYELSVEIMPKPGIADPEGATILRALHALGFDATKRVAVGKVIKLQVEASTGEEALQDGESMAAKLLANPVIEVARVSLVQPPVQLPQPPVQPPAQEHVASPD